MDYLKTPHEKLLEEAGAIPQSEGMLRTPKQQLFQEVGLIPHLASGGQLVMSPNDMIAALIAHGIDPQRFANGGGVMGTTFQPEHNPEAKMQATPFLSSDAPVTNYVKSHFADLFGQTAADRIFGGPQGQDAIYQAAQMANPVTGALGVADMPFNLYEDLKKKDYLGAGLTTAGGALSAVPAFKPAKKLASSSYEKLKKLLKP